MEKMLRQTVHGKFYIDASTWKLDQNKPENVRLRAADQVEQHNVGCDTHLLASFMREAYTLLIIGKICFDFKHVY